MSESSRGGWIDWFARNPVAANLLMVAIILSGIYALTRALPYEVFPSLELDVISVNGSYAGASPQEVEKQITIEVENAIDDFNFIESIRASSREGVSRVDAELSPGTDKEWAKTEIQSRLDSKLWNEDIETPLAVTAQFRREVINLALSGAVDMRALLQWAERLRSELLARPEITQVELGETPDYEIAIEVDPDLMRRYDLNLQSIADAIGRQSGDFAAGDLKSQSGEILLRPQGQASDAEAFSQLLIRGDDSGRSLRLGDVASISDGFGEATVINRFNGEPAVLLSLYQVNDQSSLVISEIAKQIVAQRPDWLPEQVKLDYWKDNAKVLRSRLNTLTRNAIQGFCLVFLLLALFLRPKVAFWVAIGIPVSFMGGFAMMPLQGVSVNLITLFAFIVVLGIVVDDAIVTGENIYAQAKRGKSGLDASIDGTREIAVPVTFGVLTTVAAFVPLFFFPGARGQMFAQIPAVVIPVLLFSLIESKLILPAHLASLDLSKKPKNPILRGIDAIQRSVANGLETAVRRIYQPLLEKALNWRYPVVCMFISVLLLCVVAMLSGHMRFVFFPKIATETATARLSMQSGSSAQKTIEAVDRLAAVSDRLREDFVLEDGRSIILNILSVANEDGGRVVLELMPPEDRPGDDTDARDVVAKWREGVGALPGAESLSFRAEIGRISDPVNVQIEGFDLPRLTAAVGDVRQKLAQFPALNDISDSQSGGKSELSIRLKPGAELRGVSIREVASQIRTAFYGQKIQTLQRDNHTVDVVLRFPLDHRQRIADLESLLIPSQAGFIPLKYIADLEQKRGSSVLYRNDKKRSANVWADADKSRADMEAIKRELRNWRDVDFAEKYPSLSMSFEGEAKEQSTTFAAMRINALGALLAIYVLLAIPFRSYLQPLLVMSVIPFGIIGAFFGHVMLGMTMSIMSVLGVTALSGVIVNDSLVLVDFVNRELRKQKQTATPEQRAAWQQALHKAIRQAGVSRFRPVLLTSLTTFIGLVPLLTERSTQAQFLIPMAVSLGFGILFATFITLILVPCNYLILEDLKRLFRRLW